MSVACRYSVCDPRTDLTWLDCLNDAQNTSLEVLTSLHSICLFSCPYYRSLPTVALFSVCCLFVFCLFSFCLFCLCGLCRFGSSTKLSCTSAFCNRWSLYLSYIYIFLKFVCQIKLHHCIWNDSLLSSNISTTRISFFVFVLRFYLS